MRTYAPKPGDIERAWLVIDATDVDLVQVCDEPQQVVDAIFNFYEKRGFEPSPAEREVLLNL